MSNHSTTMIPRNDAQVLTSRGIVITDMEGLARFAKMVADSGLAPKGMEGAARIGVAIQLGLELGLSPMSALQNIGVINGRPGVFGDAAKALVESSGLLEEFREWLEISPGKEVDELPATIPDTARGVCYSKRKNRKAGPPAIFSVVDAKRAQLWGKAGPWTQYPGRMLKFRARGFNLRDNFTDVLKGFRTVEELQDFPEEFRQESIPTTACEVPTPPAVQPDTDVKIVDAVQLGTITPRQLQKLAILCDKTGYTKDDLTGEYPGLISRKQLSKEQASDLIEKLQEREAIQGQGA